jgi:hypothetical protein
MLDDPRVSFAISARGQQSGLDHLHKRLDNYEIERCKIWLDVERSLIKPDTIVALRVTAARSLTGRTLTIGKVRGKPITMADGCSPARENQCLWDRCFWLVRERDWDDDAFKGDEAPAPVLADSSFSFIALSTAVYLVMFGAVCLLQCFEQQPPARRKISTCRLK